MEGRIRLRARRKVTLASLLPARRTEAARWPPQVTVVPSSLIGRRMRRQSTSLLESRAIGEAAQLLCAMADELSSGRRDSGFDSSMLEIREMAVMVKRSARAGLSGLLFVGALALLAACEEVPGNLISCKVDTDCPDKPPQRCQGNVCRRRLANDGAAGVRPAAGAAAKSGPISGMTGTAVGAQSVAGASSATSGKPSTPSTGAVAGSGAAAAGAAGPPVVVMCSDESCVPNGKCVQGATDWTCACNEDFHPSEGGKRCILNNDCPELACTPGGKCVDGLHTFTCMCDPGFEGTGTNACRPAAGGAALSGACPMDTCSPGGQCVPAGADYTCKCSVELRTPDPKSCALLDKQDGTVFDVKRNLTWQKMIGSTAKGALSPLDDATTAMRYCSAVTQPAATWRVPTADEMRSLPALASDRHACFGTTGGIVCNDVPVDSTGQTTPANMIDMRCVH